MKLEILSCNTDRRGVIGANHLEVKVNGHEISLPCPCANRSDYNKAEQIGIPIQSRLFQHHVDISQYDDLSNLPDTVKKHHSAILDRPEPLLATDCNFYYDGHTWTDKQWRIVLEAQKNLDITFLSDVVFDRNQSLQSFQKRLDELDSIETNAIKCPTISIRSDFTEFVEHLDHIIDKKYPRFNVEWGGLGKYNDRWVYLSNSIRNKKIWCNVVAIHPPKPTRGLKRSNMAAAMAFGAHTFGHGHQSWPNDRDEHEDERDIKSWRLDDTWCYSETDIPPDNALVESHNIMFNMAKSAKQRIDNKNFYSDFVPKQFNLSGLYSV